MVGGWKARFFTIWIGQQLSIVGTVAAQFALVWWLTRTTGSATVLATASLVAMIPQIALGPFVGAFVDRWNRRTVMIAADSFIALVGLWLAYLFWTDVLQIWHVYVVVFARSFGQAFHGPAMAASTTLMVPDRHYTRIGGLNQTIYGLLSIVGPPLGALLMSLMPLHGVMMVDVGTAAFAVLPLLVLTIPQPEAHEIEAVKAASVVSNARKGLRFVLSWPGLVVLLACASVLKIALMPAFSLLPLLVKDHFAGGASQLALFEAMTGGGILAGGVLLSLWGGFRRKILTVLAGLTGVGLAATLLGLTPSGMFWLGLVAVFVLGIMLSLTDGPIAALLQSTVPAAMQGRVFALLGSLFSLTTPIGLAIAGPVADVTGVPFWLLLGGLICTATAGVGFFVPALIRIEDQKRADVFPVARGEGDLRPGDGPAECRSAVDRVNRSS